MLVAVPPAQPAAPLQQIAIVRKVKELAIHGPSHPPSEAGLRAHRHGGAHGDAHRRHNHHLAHHRVYHPAGASWYGGGGSLACGGSLTSSTLGVANKTLPCGTLVSLRYHGRQVRVRVIDRGPYVAGREFDLTEATKRALGFGDVGEVWWSIA